MKMRIGRVTHGERVLAVEFDGERMHVRDGVFAGGRTGEVIEAGSAAALSPCSPAKVLVLSRGWNPIEGWTAETAAEVAGVTVAHAQRWLDGSALPGETPFVNPKLTSDVTGDGAEIRVPSFLTIDVWVESELAVVLGRDVYRASRQAAADAIFGYTIFNDVTAREFLQPHKDYFRAKCNETFASMGPWVDTSITEDDIASGLEVACRVNGQTRVRANTRALRFTPSEVISAIAMHTPLRRGDVIALGCPPPPPCAQPGDQVELEIEGIGVLHNTVVAEPMIAE